MIFATVYSNTTKASSIQLDRDSPITLFIEPVPLFWIYQKTIAVNTVANAKTLKWIKNSSVFQNLFLSHSPSFHF
jgi:hypothetical protein